MSNQIDALVYSQIKNTITNPSTDRFKITKDILSSDTNQNVISTMNTLMKYTTIKRACCMAKQMNHDAQGSLTESDTYEIKIKIPVPKNYNPGNDADLNEAKLRGYIWQTVKVPLTMCKTYLDPNYSLDRSTDAGFDKCENFYKGYCSNKKNMYDIDLNGQGNLADFVVKYSKKECACFIDKPADLSTVQASGPRSCWAPQCAMNNADVAFLDNSSRKNPCSGTYCISNTTIGNVTAQYSGSVNLYTSNNQQCGQNTNNTDKDKTAADKAAADKTPTTPTTTPTKTADKAATDKAAADKAADTTQTPTTPTPTTPTPTTPTPTTTKTPTPTTPTPTKTPTPSGTLVGTSLTSEEESGISKYKYYIAGGIGCLSCISILIILFFVLRKKKSNDD